MSMLLRRVASRLGCGGPGAVGPLLLQLLPLRAATSATTCRTFVSSPTDAPWLVSNLEAKAVDDLRKLVDEEKELRPSPETPHSVESESTPSDPTAAEDRREVGGPKGKEPTRFGDWEQNGRCTDF